MATKLRKRVSTKRNKLVEFDKFELKDVICSICQSILVEPVTLPCHHFFCQRCFSGSVENNALCCPLCRLRIGSWLRIATKQNNLVNGDLWDYIQKKFPIEIDIKLKGGDVYLDDNPTPIPRLSAPGEIRSEYERELERLNRERIQLEQKHIQETELLIKEIQLKEAEEHKKYMEMLKQDEMLAKQILKQDMTKASTKIKKPPQRYANAKPRLKPTRIDGFLAKSQAPVNLSTPLLTDDNTSISESSTPMNTPISPEMVPKITRTLIEKKCANSAQRSHNGDLNGQHFLKNSDEKPSQINRPVEINEQKKFNGDVSNCKIIVPKSKAAGPKPRNSLPVSLPLPFSRIPKNKPLSLDQNKFIPLGTIQRRNDLHYKNKLLFMISNKKGKSQEKDESNVAVEENKCNVLPEVIKSADKKSENEKVDEGDKILGIRKPVDKNAVQEKGNVSDRILGPEKSEDKKDAPNRILGTGSVDSMHQELCYFKPIEKSPSRTFAQCNTNLPVRVPCLRASGQPKIRPPRTTFGTPSRAQYIEGLCRLRQLSLANKLSSAFVIALDMLKVKQGAFAPAFDNKRTSPEEQLLPMKRNVANKNVKSITHANCESTLGRRRTRSMGSLAKNVMTPKRIKTDGRNAISERKPYLRSDSNKTPKKTPNHTPSKLISNNPNRAAKNLTDPLNDCDVKTIYEQIRIQELIAQEQQDMELARKLDAEMNGRRQMRRPGPVKRQVTLDHTLRPAKKLKV